MELITAVVVAIMAVWPQPVVFIDYGHPHPFLLFVCVFCNPFSPLFEICEKIRGSNCYYVPANAPTD